MEHDGRVVKWGGGEKTPTPTLPADVGDGLSVPAAFGLESAASARGLVSSRVAVEMAAVGVDHFADFSWVTESPGSLDQFLARLREGFAVAHRYTNLNGWHVLNPPTSHFSFHIYRLTLPDDGVAFLMLEVGNADETPLMQGNVGARSPQEIEYVLRTLLRLFPAYVAPVVAKDPKQFVHFWMMGGTGPSAISRLLDVVEWGAISQNYPRGVCEAVGSLATRTYRPQKSGQIMLFTGPPGCGKTFSIRALAWEWRRWCTTHYIMDPPALFSGSPAYIHSILFGKQEQPLTVRWEDEGEEEPLAPPERWRLIVLEDSGELIAEDAREQTGQGLARLLNAADGLLGQGSRVMFLITTNEPIEKLHPAVVRPGRCAANILYTPLSVKEANGWLEQHGSALRVTAPQTIADLFALVGHRPVQTVVEKERRLGFA